MKTKLFPVNTHSFVGFLKIFNFLRIKRVKNVAQNKLWTSRITLTKDNFSWTDNFETAMGTARTNNIHHEREQSTILTMLGEQESAW